MENFIGIIAALASLTAAAYAHRKIPDFTATPGKAWVARAILLAVGIAFATVMSSYLTHAPQKLIAFLASFGIVHLPAAFILMIKASRGDKRS